MAPPQGQPGTSFHVWSGLTDKRFIMPSPETGPKTLEPQELTLAVNLHSLWLEGMAGGQQAVFRRCGIEHARLARADRKSVV